MAKPRGGKKSIAEGANTLPSVRKVLYTQDMAGYKFSEYFEKEVLRKRPYLKRE